MTDCKEFLRAEGETALKGQPLHGVLPQFGEGNQAEAAG